jgi:hypothetical protein
MLRLEDVPSGILAPLTGLKAVSGARLERRLLRVVDGGVCGAAGRCMGWACGALYAACCGAAGRGCTGAAIGA